MVLLLSIVAFLILGVELTYIAWPRASERAPGALERSLYALSIAACVWLATTWILAITGLLTFWSLVARLVAISGVALWLARRRLQGSQPWRATLSRNALLALTALLPLLLWGEIMFWRGAVVPPLSHDALSYHLPKAVFFSRAHGFEYLEALDPRQRNIPANYELLLTEILVVQQRDTYTEWPSVIFYLMFVVACGALVEQWLRGRSAAGLAVMVFAGAIPVAMLHSGAHKNDLLVAFCMVAALVAAGRWLSTKEIAALRILIGVLCLGMGTKPQVAGLAICLMPFVLAPLLRPFRWKPLASNTIFAIVAFFILGGMVYAINFKHERSMMGTTPDAESVVTYGDWRNLWEGPYILLAAPFARLDTALEVPWEKEPYFWRRHEIYFSHLGIPFSLCAMAVPIAIWLQRRGGLSVRLQVTAASFATVLLMLPVVFRPHGMYTISLPRYLLFIVPVVFAWTLAPLASANVRRAALVWVAGTIAFCVYGADTLLNDRFAPLDYVLWAREHPGTRHIPFDPTRAASAVDSVAGPSDTIVFDATYASWIHPAFGAELRRPLLFIPEGTGAPVIPEDAKWVVIDRSWNIIWGETGMNDLTEYRKLGQGQLKPEDVRVRDALRQDPRFRLVYAREGLNQLVFQRIGGAAAPPPARSQALH